jgi:hypothetical protein
MTVTTLKIHRITLLALLLLAGYAGRSMSADITNPGDPVVPSSLNSPGGEPAPNAIDNRVLTKYLNFDELNTGFTVVPTTLGVPVVGLGLISANDAAERDPASFTLEGSNDGINFTPISSGAVPAFAFRHQIQQFAFANSTSYLQYRVLFPTVQNAGAANSMQIAEVQLLRALDLTLPGDAIVGSSTNTPAGEVVANAIDNRVLTKYLNFDKLNTGLTVAANGGQLTRVNGLGLIAANDAVERDPSSYVLEGSTDGVSYNLISQGAVAPFAFRHATQDILFPNDSFYSSYRLTFPTVVNEVAANSMQIAEIQLYGTVIPEPSTWLLVLLTLAGFWKLRRR